MMNIRLKSGTFEQLINEVKIKLVIDLVILTPSGLHSEQTIVAANLGINVCTEKPMATNWEDGIKMVNSCSKNKVKLYVVKQNRFNKTLKLLKKQLSQGRFGKLALITVTVFGKGLKSIMTQMIERNKKLDGGVIDESLAIT